MLDATLKAQLKTYLERITLPVELVASLDDSAAASQMRALLEDIAALQPLVSARFGGDDADQRTDRDVDMAGDDDHRHADSSDGDIGISREDGVDVGVRQEPRIYGADHHEQDED